MITKQDIDANRPVIVKWDKALLNTNGQVTEGVLAGQAEEFITRIEEESELLSLFNHLHLILFKTILFSNLFPSYWVTISHFIIIRNFHWFPNI